MTLDGPDTLDVIIRLDCALYPLGQLIEQLDAIEVMDNGLLPELNAARAGIAEVAAAIGRAAQFAKARFDVNEAA